MNLPEPARTPPRRRLEPGWLLPLFALLTITLALFDPQPLARHQHWLQLPTLAGLLGLLIAIQGIRDSGMVQHAAVLLAARMRSLRMLGMLLVAVAALLSMALTNDASLFLIVPLTLAVGNMSNLPIVRMVVLEALAVNAGSTLSPIGNPQNLLLCQHFGLSFVEFVLGMLPVAAVMLTLVVLLALCWLPRGDVAFNVSQFDAAIRSRRLGVCSIAALLTVVLAIDQGHAVAGAALLLTLFAVRGRASLLHVDWPLLLLFALIFLALGHLAELPAVSHALALLDWHRPLTLYASGIVMSQFISNVPATVLLLDHAANPLILAAAVNVGGFGLATGSLANLIALRLLRGRTGVATLHRASIPVLLICAPLVYLVLCWTRS